MKKSHPYYYQVQAQLLCTKGRYCDFVVWTEEVFHCERITSDAEFFREFIQQSKRFFKQCILVEILGTFYTAPRNTSLTSVQATASGRDNYCYFEGPVEGNMIVCDNGNYPYQWFHSKCLDMQFPKRKKGFVQTA